MLAGTFHEAWTALQYNHRSTALTMLGIAWGIATVVLLLAYGNGCGQVMTNIFASFGTKTMILIPGRTSMQAGGRKAGTLLRFTLDDVDLLRTNVPQISRITPEVHKKSSVQYESRTFNFGVVGDHPNVASIRVLAPARGRFFNVDDELQRARVAVLSSEAKEKLFSGRNALGEHVRIDGLSFEVIGVLRAKMQEGDDDINRIVYVPFTTMGDLADIHFLNSIAFNYEVNDYEGLERAVRAVMAIQHKFSLSDRRALSVYSVMDQVHQFQMMALGFKVLLALIGTITLGTGGVGLMNIMLVSVTQRTREIGIERALGSRQRDVFFRFLTEALSISFIGGALGVVLAYVIAHSVGRLTLYSAMATHAEAGDIQLLIDPGTLMIATLILIAVALVSGMIPAIRASRLDPIEALRHE
ncbi:MAG: ABC transporter permease [Candidatus Sulfotelmatobacter sp.]